MDQGSLHRWRHFLKTQRSMVGILALGLIVCTGVIGYTLYLSRQLLDCPQWARDCQVSNAIQWTRRNIGVVQGIATAIYTIGLMCLVYFARQVSASAIWPLLRKQKFNVDQVETYLSAIRGSIMDIPASMLLINTASTALILIITTTVSLVPLTAAPIVGNVYNRENQTWMFESAYRVGGGIGRVFAQTNPPACSGAESLSSYIAWSRKLSQEPMPEYREWVVDRSKLRDRGNLTVRAVKTEIRIKCHPYEVTPLNSNGTVSFFFKTNIARHDREETRVNSSAHVQVRAAPALTVWVDDYNFQTANRTSATLVFAAVNGTVEGGSTTSLLGPSSSSVSSISAIACDVDLELRDDVLIVGQGGPMPSENITISAIAGMRNYGRNAQTQNKTNEDALWFAVAPVLVGLSLSGAQPMYYGHESLPIPYTSTNTVANSWTVSEIEHFIRVSIGAVALSASRIHEISQREEVFVSSSTRIRKLEQSRVVYLVFPMAAILAGVICLVICNNHLHRQSGISVMRTASMNELLESSQVRLRCNYTDAEMRQVQGASKTIVLNASSEILLPHNGLDVEPDNCIDHFSSAIPVSSSPASRRHSEAQVIH